MKYDINLVMQKYIDDGQIPNGVLLVNQDTGVILMWKNISRYKTTASSV